MKKYILALLCGALLPVAAQTAVPARAEEFVTIEQRMEGDVKLRSIRLTRRSESKDVAHRQVNIQQLPDALEWEEQWKLVRQCLGYGPEGRNERMLAFCKWWDSYTVTDADRAIGCVIVPSELYDSSKGRYRALITLQEKSGPRFTVEKVSQIRQAKARR